MPKSPDPRFCANCGRPLSAATSRAHTLQARSIYDPHQGNKWPEQLVAFCSSECVGRGILRLYAGVVG